MSIMLKTDMHVTSNQEANTTVSVFVNNRVYRYEVPIELHSDINITSQPYSRKCVRHKVLRRLERNRFTSSPAVWTPKNSEGSIGMNTF